MRERIKVAKHCGATRYAPYPQRRRTAPDELDAAGFGDNSREEKRNDRARHNNQSPITRFTGQMAECRHHRKRQRGPKHMQIGRFIVNWEFIIGHLFWFCCSPTMIEENSS